MNPDLDAPTASSTAVALHSVPRWRRILKTALLAVITLALMVSGVFALATSGLDLFQMQSAVSKVRVIGTLVQILIVAVIGLRWRALVQWGQRRNIVQEHEFERVVALRPKVMAFLCAYLVLIPIGPNNVLKLFGMS